MSAIHREACVPSPPTCHAEWPVPQHEASLPLDPEHPYFKKIVMQQVIWEADPEGHRLEKFINYLSIEAVDGKELVFGELYETGAVKGMMWLEPEVPPPCAPSCAPGVCLASSAPSGTRVPLLTSAASAPWRPSRAGAGTASPEVFRKTVKLGGLPGGWRGGL